MSFVRILQCVDRWRGVALKIQGASVRSSIKIVERGCRDGKSVKMIVTRALSLVQWSIIVNDHNFVTPPYIIF